MTLLLGLITSAAAVVAVWWKRENRRRMVARPASLLNVVSGLCWAAVLIAG